jgi:uncharacterized OB-fold protein
VRPPPLEIAACAACGHRVHPPRLACPRCHAREWRFEPAGGGTVAEVTTVRRSPLLEAGDEPIELALVRTDAGPLVIARLEDGPLEPGTRVALTCRDRRVSARAGD